MHTPEQNRILNFLRFILINENNPITAVENNFIKELLSVQPIIAASDSKFFTDRKDLLEGLFLEFIFFEGNSYNTLKNLVWIERDDDNYCSHCYGYDTGKGEIKLYHSIVNRNITYDLLLHDECYDQVKDTVKFIKKYYVEGTVLPFEINGFEGVVLIGRPLAGPEFYKINMPGNGATKFNVLPLGRSEKADQPNTEEAWENGKQKPFLFVHHRIDLDENEETIQKLINRIQNARNYLLSTQQEDLSIEKCFESLGFEKNGDFKE